MKPGGNQQTTGSAPGHAVAITGIGLVSPAGVGLAATQARLAQGPLVPTLPAGAEAALTAPLIHAVPDFDARPYLRRRKDRKLMARANQLAVVAARLAVDDAGESLGDLTDAGLYLGVGREPGTIDDVLPALAHSGSADDGARIDVQRLSEEGMRWMNPLSSLKTLPNMSLAHVGIVLGTMGPGQALCDGPSSGTRAVLEGATAIAEGRVDIALAGGADSRTAFTDRTTAVRQGLTGPMGEAAAVFVLERLDRAQARGARIYGVIGQGDGDTLTRIDWGDCGAATTVASLAVQLADGPATIDGLQIGPSETATLRVRNDEPIAITGIGMRTPLGNDFKRFARRLMAGESAAGPIRGFDATHFPVKNACEADCGALPAELAQALVGLDDRKAEFAVGAAIDAVADHGATPTSLGVVYATGLSSVSIRELEQDSLPHVRDAKTFDYAAFAAAQSAEPQSVEPQSAEPQSGSKSADRPQAPWRHLVHRPIDLLVEHLGIDGPTACHFSACAAGTAAVLHAADIIRRGEAEVMLAGGADSMVHPFGMLPFILLGATSLETDPDRAGRPFAPDRDGFVMGEGGAFFVLEPLSRARAAGRHVYGCVLGGGTSCDAYNVTAPHPDGVGAERAMRAALKDAGVAPEGIDYINAHGTGTPLNDGIESAAIRRVFGDAAPPVSSSKAQFGHTIAAAGAVELLACLAAFAHDTLPPNAHLTEVDPAVDLDLVESVGRPATPQKILSNSFGFGGQNACLVIGRAD